MEENKIERPLMSEEEFTSYVKDVKTDIVKDFYENNILHLIDYSGVSRFKSIRRAIKRGHVALDGTVFPKRPFNNAKHNAKSINNRKKMIYEHIKSNRVNTSKV